MYAFFNLFTQMLNTALDLASIDGILENLLYASPKRELLYVTSLVKTGPTNTLEHLACFLPGLLALGAHTLPISVLPPKKAEYHKWAAEGLSYTCYLLYADSRSGLSPDSVKMSEAGRWIDAVKAWEKGGRLRAIPPGMKEGGPIRKPGTDARDYFVIHPQYHLRPEVRLNFLNSLHSSFTCITRRLKAFSFCTKRPETLSGESEDGKSSKPSRSFRRQSMDMQVCRKLIRHRISR
jgi:hypothetical protein